MVEKLRILPKSVYYLLSWTWGFIMTIIGLIIISILKIYGWLFKKPMTIKKCCYSYYLNIGKSWGGVEFGMFFLTDSHDGKSTKLHEFGHGVQNCIWGPLFPFVISIPSAVRYWLRECKQKKSKYVFSIILLSIAYVVSISLILIGVLNDIIFLNILGALIAIYFSIIFIWLIAKEIPKYNTGKYVWYDDIWFERDATRTGVKYNNYLEETTNG